MAYWVWNRHGDWILRTTGTPGVYESRFGPYQCTFWCLSPTRILSFLVTLPLTDSPLTP